MKKYMKAYLGLMADCAKRLPMLLTTKYYDWHGLAGELQEVGRSLIALLILMVIVVLYPISIFVIPAFTLEAERRREKRMAAYKARPDVKKAMGVRD